MKETDGTFTYKIKLNADPGNNTTTTITPCSSNESVLKVTSGQLTFTGGSSGNWNTGQKVTVSIVDNGVAEIAHWINGGCATASLAAGANASSGPPQAAGLTVVVKVAAVTSSNRAPEFPADAVLDEPPVATENKPFTYTIQAATDPDGDTLTYKANVLEDSGKSSDLPGWLTFDGDASNGPTFTGTPLEADTPANLKIQVSASDDEASDTVTFTLTVEEVQQILEANKVEATTASLTIANYSGNWYYKYTSPSDGTCSTKIAAGTNAADLTGLSGNTAYTYTAYSDSSCTDANELAVTDPFLTKPGQPTTPTVAAGAGSGKLTLTATVTGSGAITGWQVQQKASTDSDFGTWQDVASISQSLSYTITGLTENTSYQFKVRAVNATGNGVASDASTAVAPTDESLTASTVEATTATLTIGNHSGNWHYKYTSPSGGICSAEIAAGTNTADLTDLSGNTSYTFKAYSDSSCTAELAVTDPFLTKPGQPTTPTVAAGAGSGKLTLTASVTGSGAITGWQVQQKASTDSDFGAWKDIRLHPLPVNLTHTDHRPHRKHQLPVQGACRERHWQRCDFGCFHRRRTNR